MGRCEREVVKQIKRPFLDDQVLPPKMVRAFAFLALVLAPAYSHLFDSCMSREDTPNTSDDSSFFYVRADIKDVSKEDSMTIAAYSGLIARGGAKMAMIGKANDKVWLDAMLEEVRL